MSRISFRPWPILYFLTVCLWLSLAFFFRIDRLYGDASFYLQNTINKLEPFITHDRPASYFIQFIPCVLAKYNFSMEAVASWLSYSEALLIFLISLVPVIFWRDFYFSTAIMLVNFLGIKWNYFNPVSELLLSFGFLILLIGGMARQPSSIWIKWMFFPIVWLLVKSHPLYSILILAAYGLLLFSKKISNRWALVHILYTLWMIWITLNSYDAYDNQQMNYYDNESFLSTLSRLLSFKGLEILSISFGALFLLGVYVLTVFYKTGRIWVFIYTLSFLVFYTSLVLYRYGALFPDTFETFERYMYPSSVFICITLCFIQPVVKEVILPFLLLIGVVFNSIQIVNYGSKVKRRNLQISNILTYAQSNNWCKVLIRGANFNPNGLSSNWIITSESLILSEMTGNRKTVQLAISEAFDTALLARICTCEYVEFPRYAMNHKELNPEFFRLFDQPFRPLNSKIDSSKSEHLFSNYKYRLSFEKERFNVSRWGIWTNIQMNNNAPDYLPSGVEPLLVRVNGYWSLDGRKLSKAFSEPLIADWRGELNQLVKLNTNIEPGNYRILFSLSIGENEIFPECYSDSIIIE